MKAFRIIVCIVFVLSVGCYKGNDYIKSQAVDSTYPTIESTSDKIKVPCNATEEDLLAGVTAMDGKDGDITDSILIDNISTFIEKGLANIQYVVFDSDMNFSTFTRKVQFEDYRSPQFHLSAPLIFFENDQMRLLDRLTAYDCIDGDISGQIKLTSNSYTAMGETQSINAEVCNSYGDVSTITLAITMEEKDMMAPSITLSDYLVYIKKGSSLDPLSYIQDVTSYYEEKIALDMVSITTELDTNTIGTYEVLYSITEEQHTGKTKLIVIVEE